MTQFQEIDLPDGSIGEFPLDMPEDEISAVLRREFPSEAAGDTRVDEVPFSFSRIGKQASISIGQGVADVARFAEALETRRGAEADRPIESHAGLRLFGMRLKAIKQNEGLDRISEERLVNE